MIGAQYPDGYHQDWKQSHRKGRLHILPRHLPAAKQFLKHVDYAVRWAEMHLTRRVASVSKDFFHANEEARTWMRDCEALIRKASDSAANSRPDQPDAPDTEIVIPNVFDDEGESPVPM